MSFQKNTLPQLMHLQYPFGIASLKRIYLENMPSSFLTRSGLPLFAASFAMDGSFFFLLM